MSVLPNRQRAITSGTVGHVVQDLLQQLDFDYYRSALLHVARAELERLRQGRSEGDYVEGQSKSPFGAPPSVERAASPAVACAGLLGGSDAVRGE
jgi:hypothetical protein